MRIGPLMIHHTGVLMVSQHLCGAWGRRQCPQHHPPGPDLPLWVPLPLWTRSFGLGAGLDECWQPEAGRVTAYPTSSMWILTTVHTMMNVLGTPARARGEQGGEKAQDTGRGQKVQGEGRGYRQRAQGEGRGYRKGMGGFQRKNGRGRESGELSELLGTAA